MSIPAVAETTPATTDAQVIADMAAAVLASIARIHADGLVAVSTIAENHVPVRLELPPVAEEPVAELAAELIDDEPAELIEDDEPAELEAEPAVAIDDEAETEPAVEAEAEAEPAVEAEVEAEAEAGLAVEIDDEPVVRIAEPIWTAPQPRGRHFSEAVTDQLPVQHAA